MKRLIGFLVLVIFFSACGKDKFTTEPQVEVKSLTPSAVQNGGFINFRAELRDREGDFDSVLLVRKRFNGNNLLNSDTIRTTISNLDIPNNEQVELNVIISYGVIRSDVTSFHESLAPVDNRYLSVGVVVIDKEQHRSNFAESEKILLRRL